MKQPINMILATLVLLWSVNATAGAQNLILPMYPEAKSIHLQQKSHDNHHPLLHPTCSTWMVYASKTKVEAYFRKALKNKKISFFESDAHFYINYQSEESPYFGTLWETWDPVIYMESVQTKIGDKFFEGLLQEAGPPHHTQSEYFAMEKKYKYLKSMYYPDNYDAKLLKEYKAKTRSGQRENVINHHPDAATAKASATDMQKTMQDLHASGASPQELIAAMMQYQMQNQQGVLAQGRQAKAFHDVEMTDYWNDWVEFLEKLATKATYATKVMIKHYKPSAEDEHIPADTKIFISGQPECQGF